MSNGKVDQAKGRMKKAVGELTDDQELKDEGTLDETGGKVKEGVARVVDRTKDSLTGKDRRR